tara:strand:- start:11 stop:319 length:309 start_codon:yes stop_codon:yes gene_type:complete
MKKTKYDSPAFLKITATDAGVSPLYVRAEEILNVDKESNTVTSIHLAAGGKIELTTGTDSTATVQAGIYSAIQRAFNRRGSAGEPFTVAVSSSADVEVYAFS